MFCGELRHTGCSPSAHWHTYSISLLIRQSFSFLNNPKDLDPSYKMDLDLWDCLGRVKLVFQQNCIELI